MVGFVITGRSVRGCQYLQNKQLSKAASKPHQGYQLHEHTRCPPTFICANSKPCDQRAWRSQASHYPRTWCGSRPRYHCDNQRSIVRYTPAAGSNTPLLPVRHQHHQRTTGPAMRLPMRLWGGHPLGPVLLRPLARPAPPTPTPDALLKPPCASLRRRASA